MITKKQDNTDTNIGSAVQPGFGENRWASETTIAWSGRRRPFDLKAVNHSLRKACRRAATLALLGFFLFFGRDCKAETFAEQIHGKVASLRETLPFAEDLKDHRDQIAARLSEIEAAAQSGNTYLTLYLLEPLWDAVHPYEYVRSKSGVAKQGVEAFNSEWHNMQAILREMDAEVDRGYSNKFPLAVRGLIQICKTKSAEYYQSSLAFGQDTTPQYGLYYVGAAKSHLEYAIFLEKIDFAGQGSGGDIRSISAELDQLDSEIVDTYKKLDSPKLVEEFIALNSNMELARQLEQAGRMDGALIAYLETSLKLGMLLLSQPSAERRDAGPALEQFERRISDPDRSDASIAQIYTDAARRAFAKKSSPQDSLKAEVLVERVLPAYFKITMESQK